LAHRHLRGVVMCHFLLKAISSRVWVLRLGLPDLPSIR